MRRRTYALACALAALPALAACSRAAAPEAAAPPTAAAPAAEAPLLSFRDLLTQPRAKADARIAYGAEPLQFGELWLPAGQGPHPVVVLIHGGCWQASLPGTELMDYMAADLRGRGYAVWNLEYRRLGGEGGGYPGTFRDVAAGVDHLRSLAPAHGLDLGRAVLSGHSAGGHLALWAAARPRLPIVSPLHEADPLPVRGVVTLAGINDLEAYRADGPAACGGPETIDGLVGPVGRAPDLYADTSPPRLLPLATPQVVISGGRDPIVPPRFGQAYAARAAASGGTVTETTLPRAGHFELIDPRSDAWATVLAAYEGLLRPATR